MTKTKTALGRLYVQTSNLASQAAKDSQKADTARKAARAAFDKARGELLAASENGDDYALVIGDQVLLIAPGIPSVKCFPRVD